MLALHNLNRIQLPMYKPQLFDQGLSDYPSEVLEKVGSKRLADVAPKVYQIYQRFNLGNSAQEAMMGRVEAEAISAHTAACDWLKDSENTETWKMWLPTEEFTCST